MKLLARLLCGVIVIPLLGISCVNSTEETPNETTLSVQAEGRYGDTGFQFPAISTIASDQVLEWSIFEDFKTEAISLNGKSIEELKIRSERLLTHIDSLSNNIPDTLNTSTLSARVIVVQTRGSLLYQELNKSRIDSVKLQVSIDEMNLSVRNLIIGINEKFEKDEIDLEQKEGEKQELEKQKRFLDSIYQIELQDKNQK